MAFRSILIESAARLSLKNSQLIIRTDCDHSVAVEDISALLLENRQSTITAAARFRNFLLNDGYYMVQYSVYVRICNGMDAVKKHRDRIPVWLPENGSVRLLVVTEKQYESMDILLGAMTQADESFQCEQLSIF